MTGLLLALVLTAQPNLFEPKEPSSEDIFTQVAICMDKALREVPGATETSAVVTCGCLMDAQRANLRKGLKPAPTPEQEKRCHALAKERGKKASPAGGRTGT